MYEKKKYIMHCYWHGGPTDNAIRGCFGFPHRFAIVETIIFKISDTVLQLFGNYST